MALRVIALSCVVFLVSLIGFAAAMATTEAPCQYSVSVQTGDYAGAGTDSTISLQLKSQSGASFPIANLVDWGLMQPGHVYFQRGNLDFFGGTGNCLHVCAMTVTSSGTGSMPRWYLTEVNVTVSGPVKVDISFPVKRWLAKDVPPGSLSATVDSCYRFYPLKPALLSV
ncbi:PLAT domain-containing protein 3-like [Neltuma alba]|uniref:PLAT domain-containing protein 3-like n=1 Tax=Neltuma alba TaxID=207710 RepID=UPI0010A4F32B|nr:PLAT domain-containing protein 3-like [Prosopis alba]